MCARIKAAADARRDDHFVIMARTDAFAREGLAAAIARCRAYVEAGADMVFAEALHDLDDFAAFASQLDAPVLANLTEFGVTPTYTAAELGEVGVKIVLYPLSAFRAMSRAAENVYQTIFDTGTTRDLLDVMQTREELYDVLDYLTYERRLDELPDL